MNVYCGETTLAALLSPACGEPQWDSQWFVRMVTYGGGFDAYEKHASS